MATKKAARFFIVNPAGAVHEVPEAMAKERLAQVGYRMASKTEVEAYLAADVQRFDRPIAEPFNPEPVGVEL